MTECAERLEDLRNSNEDGSENLQQKLNINDGNSEQAPKKDESGTSTTLSVSSNVECLHRVPRVKTEEPPKAAHKTPSQELERAEHSPQDINTEEDLRRQTETGVVGGQSETKEQPKAAHKTPSRELERAEHSPQGINTEEDLRIQTETGVVGGQSETKEQPKAAHKTPSRELERAEHSPQGINTEEDLRIQTETSEVGGQSETKQDLDKILAAFYSKMQMTVILSGSVSAIISVTLTLLLRGSPAPVEVGSNATVVAEPKLSPLGWTVNKSVVILTTENKNYVFDVDTFRHHHSYADFQAQLQKQSEFSMMQMNRSLEALMVLLKQVEQHCDTEVGDVRSEFSKILNNLTQSLSDQNTRLKAQEITVLLAVNSTRLLEVNQTVLFERLIKGEDLLQGLDRSMKRLALKQEETASKSSTAYERSLRATTDKGLQSFPLFPILLSVVLGFLIDLLLVIFCLRRFNLHITGETTTTTPSPSPSASASQPVVTVPATTEKNGSSSVRPTREDSIHYRNLEKLVTVISCEQATLRNFEPQILSIANDVQKKVKAEYISEPQDFASVAGSKVMIVLVDRNERDVILEDRGLLQGDKYVRMVKIMISNAVDVFVVYVGHSESADLQQPNLYHTSLSSVRSHPILQSLNQKGRVFSIKQRFSAHQNAKLREAFRNI